jgi:type I restriction enzyme R subunit
VTIGSEAGAVQHPLVKYAADAGWTYISREDALALRGDESGLVLTDTLATQLERLNPGRVNRPQMAELIRSLTRVSPTLAGNFAVWEFLRGLKTTYDEVERRELNVRFLDAGEAGNNTFHVTEEWSYRERPESEAIRFDLAFLINGIPVLVVETKAATKKEGMAEALDQIRRYHKEGAEQMALVQLFGVTHIIRFLYGATWNTDRKNVYDWRDEAAGNFEDLVKAFVDQKRLLRILYDFIVFPTVDGELSKFVLRPHQMRAADKVVARGKDPTKHRGLIWHTQGSGKTFTMITAGKLMQADPDLANPTILIIVDRIDLEGQMEGQLDALGLQDAQVVRSRRELEETLRSDRRGIILSTIHKFDEMPAALCTRDNVIVLIDEGHRSTEGDLGTYLMAALPNATLIGFTGTPVDKSAQGKGTFKLFGRDDPEGFLDKYSIRDSIADGTTIPLDYGLAAHDLLVKRETLEEEFFRVAELEGVSDIETLNKVLERAVVLKEEMKSGARVGAIAKRVAEHFRENVEKSGYKAFLVAVDREACALYKEALDRYLPAEYSEVIISAAHNDPESLKKFDHGKATEERIRKAFRKPDALPKILIVTDKLLTGFDAPVLQCMYLDKPMRDHVLLQAVARLNRPYEDPDGRPKTAGLIIDFVGILANLEKALLFDSQDIVGVLVNLEDVQKRFAALLGEGRGEYLTISAGLTGDKEVEALVEYFRDPELRQRLQKAISELEGLYEVISPDTFLRPYLADYEALMRIAAVVRAAFSPGLEIDRSFLRKTAELVQRNTEASPIPILTATQRLTPDEIEAVVSDPQRSDLAKVIDLARLVHDYVAREKALQPALILIGERAEEIAEAFRDRLLSTGEALKQLVEQVEKIVEAKEATAKSGLAPEAVAALFFLTGRGVPRSSADGMAAQIGEVLYTYPEWRGSGQQERDLRLRLYGILLRAGIGGDQASLVDGFLGMLREVRP